jgi:hypothetical protein
MEGMLRSGKEFFTGIPVGESGRTISNLDRGYIDDILSESRKKKLDNPPEESISVKDVTDIYF